MHVGIPFQTNHGKAEQILLNLAQKHTMVMARQAEGALAELERKYSVRRQDLDPRGE